jgi:hypothetical protein
MAFRRLISMNSWDHHRYQTVSVYRHFVPQTAAACPVAAPTHSNAQRQQGWVASGSDGGPISQLGEWRRRKAASKRRMKIREDLRWRSGRKTKGPQREATGPRYRFRNSGAEIYIMESPAVNG